LSLLLRLASLRSLTRRPSQIVLSIMGVALGVCVVVAVDLAAGSARSAFALSSAVGWCQVAFAGSGKRGYVLAVVATPPSVE
jgi:hypothetical protein